MAPYSTGLRPVITGVGLEEQSPKQSRHDIAQIEPQAVQKHDQSKQTSMFSDAANLAFHGAPNLNNISGDYNIQVFESSRPVTIPSTSADKDQSTSESESETYARLLFSKKNGYPIWYPSPMNSVPQEYREHGIRIGDVGIISPRGQFDFLFNIMVGKDDPINQRGAPDRFIPISPPAGGWEIDLDEDYWIPGSNVMAGSVATTNQPSGIDPLDPVQYTFRCMPREGAVLALPGGAVQEDLINHGSFYTFAAKHAIDWYQYMNQRRDRAASNGSLYLVTGYDKTHVWGTASFSSVLTSDGFPLSYSSTDPGIGTRKYSHVWTQSGSATTRTGPPLQNCDDEGNRRRNQCVFVRGYKITLAETIWQKLLVGQVTVEHTRQISYSASAVPFRDPIQLGWKSFLPSNTWTKTGGTFDSSELKDNDLESSISPVVSSIVPQPSNSLHPSNVINQWLLDMHHQASCAITHDSVWCSTIKELDGTPDTPTLIELVERNYNIKTENGCLGVEAKTCPSGEMENEQALTDKLQDIAYETNANEDGLVDSALEPGGYITPPSSAGSSPSLQGVSLDLPSSPFISPLNLEDIKVNPVFSDHPRMNNNGEGKPSDSFRSIRVYPTHRIHQISSSEPTSVVTLLIVGTPGCGKSTIIEKGLKGHELDDPESIPVLSMQGTSTKYSRQKGVIRYVKGPVHSLHVIEIDVPPEELNPTIMDWPQSLPPVNGVVICYDSTQEDSFKPVDGLLRSYHALKLPLIVLACKTDLEQIVDSERTLELLSRYDVGLVEVSKTSDQAKAKMRRAFDWVLKAGDRDKRAKANEGSIDYKNPASPSALPADISLRRLFFW